MSVDLHPEGPVYGISLFSGIDGLGRGVALALSGLRTVAYVEREAYPIEVLAEEMGSSTYVVDTSSTTWYDDFDKSG